MNDLIALIAALKAKNWKQSLFLVFKVLPTFIEIVLTPQGAIMKAPMSMCQAQQQYEAMEIPELTFQLEEQINSGAVNSIVKMIIIALLKRLSGL